MLDNTTGGLTAAERRAHIEAELARYPDLPEDQLREVLNWFRREASAYDEAMVASNEAIRPAYIRFRADHLDRFSAREIMMALGFAAGILAVFALIGFLAP